MFKSDQHQRAVETLRDLWPLTYVLTVQMEERISEYMVYFANAEINRKLFNDQNSSDN